MTTRFHQHLEAAYSGAWLKKKGWIHTEKPGAKFQGSFGGAIHSIPTTSPYSVSSAEASSPL